MSWTTILDLAVLGFSLWIHGFLVGFRRGSSVKPVMVLVGYMLSFARGYVRGLKRRKP